MKRWICVTVALLLATLSAWANVQWSTIEEGYDSGFKKQAFLRIQTRGDWQLHGGQIRRNQGLAGRIADDVDFTKEEVLVIHLGETTDGGRVYIETIEWTGTALKAYYVRQPMAKSGHRGSVSSKTTTPYVIVRMNRRPGTIQWVGRNGSLGSGTTIFRPTCTCTVCSPCQHRCGCGLTTFPVDIPWQLLDYGQNCGWQNSSPCVITTPDLLEQYWCQVLGKPENKLPFVDWKNEMLVGIHLGQRATTGYRVRIVDVQLESAGKWVVRFVEVRPSASEMGAGLSRPYALVKVPRSLVQIRTQQLVGVPLGK